MRNYLIATMALAFLTINQANATACYGWHCKPPVKPAAGKTFGGGSNWWVFICPAGIITAAMVANWHNNRELTAQEAWTCGLLYWPNVK